MLLENRSAHDHAIDEPRQGDEPTVAYVVGRGHSGSTILGLVLGGAGDVIDIGEVVEGLIPGPYAKWPDPSLDDPFWSRVRADFEKRTGRSWRSAAEEIYQQARVHNLPRTLLAPRRSVWLRHLRETNREFFASISRVAGRAVIAESSKEVTRCILLARAFPRTRVIYLIRHPHEVVASDLYHVKKGGRLKLLRRQIAFEHGRPLLTLLVSARWLIGSLLAELACLVARRRVFRLRFEDLLSDPERELARLAAFVGFDAAPVAARIRDDRPLLSGPSLGGNRGVRQARESVLDRKPRDRPLERSTAVLTTAVCWPLQLAYGYGLKGRRSGAPADSTE